METIEHLAIRGIGCPIGNEIFGEEIFEMMRAYNIIYVSPEYDTLEEVRTALDYYEETNYPQIDCYYYPCLKTTTNGVDKYVFYDF